VEKTHSKRLIFCKSDRRTPLEDPSQEDALPITDLIAEEPPESPPFAFEDPSCIDKDSAYLLQEAIDEVYGPTRKRQRVMDQEDSAEQPLVVMTPFQYVEKPPVIQSPASDHAPNMFTTTNPIQVFESEPIIVDTVYTPSTGDQQDDDQVGGVDEGLSLAAAVLVTQDNDDMDVNESDEVAHHIETHYSDDQDDDMFDSICGHSWDSGVLMLEMKWSTDETSALPFSIVKRDYPFETANYIIKHKVGTSDGQYSSGRYSRWAWYYIRKNNRALRRLLHLSGGYIERKENVKDSLLLPLALTSDGTTMLIRQGAVSDSSNDVPCRSPK
jgi:hypothetical protein